ncbi:MAG: ATP-binding cassette domain-containing protein [Anaerolineaceae bacterium]|nr:ATP-binding cassette domain-containing protein [Anaerolineaceae bacterium]
MIDVRNLHKSYHTSELDTPVLHGIDLSVEQGEFLAVMGPSGCGKSTLLYVLGLMAGFDSGTVTVDGCDVEAMSRVERTRMRRERMGFVFQRFNLLPALSAEDNVGLTLRLRKQAERDGVVAMLERINLADKRHHRPSALSMGEQQRVAIARSLIARPAILFADEPTGNLDSENGKRVLALLSEFHREMGQTIIMVTHNEEAARCADRIVRMRDGRCVND